MDLTSNRVMILKRCVPLWVNSLSGWLLVWGVLTVSFPFTSQPAEARRPMPEKQEQPAKSRIPQRPIPRTHPTAASP